MASPWRRSAPRRAGRARASSSIGEGSTPLTEAGAASGEQPVKAPLPQPIEQAQSVGRFAVEEDHAHRLVESTGCCVIGQFAARGRARS
jgi:hypothetical protein